VYFVPPLKGNWVSALEVKNQNDVATGPNKKFDDIFSHVDTMHQRDRQTDGQRATATALTHSDALKKITCRYNSFHLTHQGSV